MSVTRAAPRRVAAVSQEPECAGRGHGRSCGIFVFCAPKCDRFRNIGVRRLAHHRATVPRNPKPRTVILASDERARRRPPASRIVRHDPRFAPRVSAAHDPTPSGSTSSAAGCDANGIPGHGWPPGWCSCGEELAPGTQVPGAFHAHTGDAATTQACDCRPRNYPMIDRRV